MESLNFHNHTVDIHDAWYKSHSDLIRKVAIELGAHDKIDELTLLFLGQKQKLKKHKDPNAPKRPKTGFQHFCNDFRDEIRKKNKGLKLGGIMKELSKIWESYTDEQKDKYNLIYKEAKSEYDVQLEEYNLNH